MVRKPHRGHWFKSFILQCREHLVHKSKRGERVLTLAAPYFDSRRLVAIFIVALGRSGRLSQWPIDLRAQVPSQASSSIMLLRNFSGRL